MEQTLAPGSQTFEQDLFRLYRESVITLDEALANSDSPTNLSWLINNSELTVEKKELKRPDSPLEFGSDSQSGGSSFKEFTLSLSDADENEEEAKDAP
jgi:twitching motility protein PilU